jgi:hypothetical protein
MSEWIKCSDRLPDKNAQVLCFNGGKLFGSYTLGEIRTDSDGCTAWHIFGVNENNAGFGNVTHWMPLPEPPK